jgi:hypothetical protein
MKQTILFSFSFFEIYKLIYILFPTFNFQETPTHRFSKIRYGAHIKFQKYNLQFCKSDSYNAASPCFPEEYHNLRVPESNMSSSDANLKLPHQILSLFDTDEMSRFCKSCTAEKPFVPAQGIAKYREKDE